MRLTRKILHTFAITFYLCSQAFANSVSSDTPTANAMPMIVQIYHRLDQKPVLNMVERLESISANFLGKPYLLGPLGEGKTGRYDQSPLYRTDCFDCQTFVDTVIAIALANSPKEFVHCINQVRYHEGRVTFTTRNHFTGLDWNQNNQRQGFLTDITLQITDNKNHSVAQMAYALINKPAWYQHMTPNQIKLQASSPETQKRRLLELQKKGQQLPIVQSSVPYIPLTQLFDEKGRANKFLFGQIPHGAVIEIVRPNWDLRSQIGTCLNISHLGFAFWQQGQLVFRQASSEYHQVVEVSLIDYLRKARQSPTIKGINIQVVTPQTAQSSRC